MFSRFSCRPSVFLRRHAAQGFEDPVEGLLVFKATVHRDSQDVKTGVLQQPLGVIDPQRMEICIKSSVDRPGKKPGEMVAADAEPAGGGEGSGAGAV